MPLDIDRAALDAKAESAGAPADEIKITPEMVEAGALEFVGYDERFEDVEDVVVRIYREMEKARCAVSGADLVSLL